MKNLLNALVSNTPKESISEHPFLVMREREEKNY